MVTTKPIMLKIGIVCFFLSGTIYVTDAFKSYHNMMLLLGIFLIWLYAGLPFPRYIQLPSRVNWYSIFVIAVIFSFFTNRELSMIVTIAGLMLLWWAANGLLPVACKYYSIEENDIYDIIQISMVVVLLVSLVSGGFRSSGYEGIFTNPNACGGVAATLCAVACASFLDRYIFGNMRKVVYSVGIIIFALFMALFSTSRTAVISIAIMLVLSFVFLLRSGVDRTSIMRVFLIIAVLAVVIIFLSKFTNLKRLIEQIVDKFVHKGADTFDGRTERWELIIERVRFFGNGEKTEIAAHNTFLNMLDQYGVIAFVAWVLFIAEGLLRSFRRAFTHYAFSMKYLPFFAFLCFTVTGLAEGMMLKTIMLLCVFCAGVIDGKYDDYIEEGTL